jgi:16S rRNA (cytosine967-C5)-methyltransferase
VGLKGEVSGWPEFSDGSWWVQDAAAAIPARLLNVQPGQTVLDMCAAPGGKTLQLAAAGAKVTALDRSVSRLRRVRENLARTGLAAEIAAADGVDWKDTRTFDAALLDAPCSATGTFRRHPETLWLARPGDLATVATLQKRLLDSAAMRVSPGGRLVYCVCSLEPEEGEAQAQGFLKRHPEFALDPVVPGEGGAPAASAVNGALRLLPSQMDGGMDGFFAARFIRNT